MDTDEELDEDCQVGEKGDFLSDFVDDSIIQYYVDLSAPTSLSRTISKVLINKDGTTRKVRRTDFSRGPQYSKSADPWIDNKWLQLISSPEIRDPKSRKAKE